MFRYLSEAEFEIVRKRAKVFRGQTNCAGRIAAGVLLGLHGLRCAEICGLTVGDLDDGRGAIHVDTLKHGVPRDVDLKPRITSWLAQLAKGKATSAPLFTTGRGRPLHPNQFSRAWRRLSMRWLGRTVKFHSLRHTAAQRLWIATKDMWKVREFLGHKSLTSTMIYVSSIGGLREFMPDVSDDDTFQGHLWEAG
jgi:integrase